MSRKKPAISDRLDILRSKPKKYYTIAFNASNLVDKGCSLYENIFYKFYT